MSDWIDCDGLLQQPVEELSPATGCPSVKPEHEFVKIMVQISMRHTALMNSKQPSLEQGCGPVNARKENPGSCTSSTIQNRRVVRITQTFQPSVAKPPICDDHATSGDVLADESSENTPVLISDPFHPYATNLFASLFCRHTDENLVSFSSNFGFVNLNLPVELFPTGSNHSPAKLVEHRPSGLVAPQAQGSLQSQGTDSALLIGNPPNRPEPEAQADFASFKDRSNCDANVPMAASASQQASRCLPDLLMTAAGTSDPVWPAQADQIIAASLLRSELMFEFEQSFRISFRDLSILEFSGAKWTPLSRAKFVDN